MWIKICGVRDVDFALQVATWGADAIGLNFFQPSPRSVPLSTASRISAAVSGKLLRVGLFVNHSIQEIASICAVCELDLIQLHGDEPPSFLVQLPALPVIKAFRLGPEHESLDSLIDYVERCQELGRPLWACLVDAAVPGVYGGSGAQLDWRTLGNQWSAHAPRLILAGGLNPHNVRQAIELVRPWGVDVASGVESSKGVKSADLSQAFIAMARDTR